MFAAVKLFITRCFEAVSSVIASVMWVAAKLLGFAFATGLAFGAICAFIAGSVRISVCEAVGMLAEV